MAYIHNHGPDRDFYFIFSGEKEKVRSLTPCTHSIYYFIILNTYEQNLSFLPSTPYIVCMYGHTNSKSMRRLGKVANPARGQLNR